ncbi:hypothetical protein Golob_018082, partial [Gossypium lobatum]|nr:hypothetical protein [Gossypium lobatum]
RDRVEKLYGNELCDHICALSTVQHGPPDQIVWFHNKLNGRLLDSPFESGIDWLKDATRLLDLKAFKNLITILWNIWNGCNNICFGARRMMLGGPPRSHRWIKPSIDAIKINVDAAIFDSVVDIGIIARDYDGFVLGGRAVFLNYKMDIEWAEMEPLREGIMWDRNNVTRALFETDCVSLVNQFKSRQGDILIFGFRLKEIFGLLESFINFKIKWVAHSSNKVADSLCKLAINKRCTFPFNMEYPSDIHGLVLVDAC